MNNEAVLILIKLVLAHIVGDFLLQPTHWVQERNAKHFRSIYLYVHALIHGLLSYVLLGHWAAWYIIPVISISHLLIDAIKSYYGKRHQVLWLVGDQLAHLLVIGLLCFTITKQMPDIGFYTWHNRIFMSRLLIYIVATVPTSIFIRTFINAWKPVGNSGIENAGKWIGYIERILVISFIIWNKLEAVGFLLAAKSVFRIGDMKDKEYRNLTEYILVGTLLSFGAAIILGFIVTYYFR